MTYKKLLISAAFIAVPSAAFAGAMTFWVDLTDSNRPYSQFRMDSAKCDLQRQQVAQIEKIRSDNLSAQCNNRNQSACYGSLGNSLGSIFGKSEASSAYDTCMTAYGWELMRAPESGVHKLRLITGVEYEGEFKHGNFDGQGEYRWPNGQVYKGSFLNGDFSGFGVKSKNGVVTYEGYFKKDEYEGHGKMYLEDGTVIEGEFIKGKLTGTCNFKWLDGDVFDGACVANRRQGNGIVKFANGDLFQGHYEKGERTGRGVFKYASGEQFDGIFNDGIREGSGTLRDKGGAIIYKGKWVSDCPAKSIEAALKVNLTALAHC